MAANIKITGFWNVTSCSVVESYSVTSHMAVIFFSYFFNTRPPYNVKHYVVAYLSETQI